jgi:pyrroline-5-carboxylate reductase
MPNTAASVGQSMTCIAANEKGKEMHVDTTGMN